MFRFFETLIEPLREVRTQRPPSEVLTFFRFYLYPIRGLLGITLILAGIASIGELLVYVYLGRIIDWMGQTGRENFLTEHSLALAGMFVVVVVIRPLALLASRAIINLALIPGLANSIRWQNHRYVLKQSLQFFQNDYAGRVSQKVLQTGQALREAVLNLIDGAWMLIIYIVGIVIFFFQANTLLVWPVLVWVIAYIAVIVFMVPPVRRKSANLSQANSDLMGRVVDSYTNIQSVKLFAHHSLEEAFAAEGMCKLTQASRNLMRAILSMTISLTVLNTLLIAITAGLSIHLWLAEAVSLGEIAVANGLVMRLNHMSGWVLRTLTSLFENVGTVQNGIETISQPLAIRDSPDAPALQVSSGRIVFDAVRFSYTDNAAASGLVNGCDFEIQPGEKVGLVGRSGAGKSTLVNLLLRFHDVDDGTIRIDDQNVSAVSQDSLRAAIAVVTQDTSLLHRSIRDNIAYGRAGASDEAILQAARHARADTFIPDLIDLQGRKGLDAHVGERGVKLSGGQRQRIAIARVILKDAPILVLDEATSALDSEVEAEIQLQLSKLMQGKTVLAVAHRLSTIAMLDRLIVLDQGRIVEQGNHAELVSNRGLYASLWERQSGGFIAVD
ncbi:MAG: ABC transporter ATP-binding protein [Granulosicoccus sp.]